MSDVLKSLGALSMKLEACMNGQVADPLIDGGDHRYGQQPRKATGSSQNPFDKHTTHPRDAGNLLICPLGPQSSVGAQHSPIIFD
jgi:hypothetical protein